MKLDELLEDRGRLVNRHTVPVLMDTDAAARCMRAENALEKVRQRHELASEAEAGMLQRPRTDAAKRDLDRAQDELDDAYEAAEPHMVEFRFESVGGDLWDQLVTAHPPTDEQREKADGLEYDPVTFPVVAVAFSLADPEIPQGELDSYIKALDRGETPLPVPPSASKLKAQVPSIVWEQLFAGALRVNRGRNQVPLSLSGSGTTRSTGQGSEPPSS